MSTPRYKISKVNFGAKRPAPAQPDGSPAKEDVDVELVGVDNAAWEVKLNLPAYDLAKFNKLVSVQVFLLAPGEAQPADGQGYVDSHYARSESVDVSGEQAGGEIDIPLPADAAFDTDFFGQVVLGFES